ncbi:hypothetical protein ABT382_35255 [Streptomyces pharetrae]|uniref:hypothetical protein n=1 Tax=Streptomyces pharetrae TaxID=291370 RepID=UPI0033625A35
MGDGEVGAPRCQPGEGLAVRHAGNDVPASVHDQQWCRDARCEAGEVHVAGEVACGVRSSGAPGHDVPHRRGQLRPVEAERAADGGGHRHARLQRRGPGRVTSAQAEADEPDAGDAEGVDDPVHDALVIRREGRRGRAQAGRSRWLDYDPARDWLPEPPTN